MEVTKLRVLVFLFCFATLIARLSANIAEMDDVWKQRAEEALKKAREAYEPVPQNVTDDFIEHVKKDLVKGNDTDSKGVVGIVGGGNNGNVTIEEEDEEEGGGEEVVSDDNSNGNSTATRRNLRGKHKKNKKGGPCMATNPIDRCWRCKKNWAKNRRRLANCAKGFGHKTQGGKDGKIYVVTDNSDDDVMNPKPGTLRWACIQKKPLWIIFAHDMNIKLSQELIVQSKKTIDGRGANVHVAHGAGITLQFVEHVIIHNLHIHHIKKSSGGLIRDSVDHYGHRTMADGDGISVFGSTNVWLDHLSMSECHDGLIDAIQGSTAITISNCHFTHHNDVILLGASDSYTHDELMQVTVAFNHFGKELIQRMPRCRWGFFHVVNNDYTHWKMYAIGGSQHPTIISQGNRFIAPDDPTAKEITNRNYATEEQWSKWIWRSEGDLFMNGAYFRTSGPTTAPEYSFNKLQMIKAKPASFVRRLTRFAGTLPCKKKFKC